MTVKRLLRHDFAWNADLAYAIGLLATDGNLSSDKRHISLTSCDKDLCVTFAKCLNKTNKPLLNPSGELSKKISYKVQIGDIVLYDWLLKIGLTPRKSLTIGKIDVDIKFFPDFLRGLIDGDGSIIYYKDKYNTYLNPKYIYDRLIVYFLSASEKHILWLRGMIKGLLNISGSIQIKKPGKSARGVRPMYVIKYSTKESKVLLNWIYYKKGLPCLKRKYLIAKPFLVNV